MGAPRLRPHDPREFLRLLEWVTGSSSILEIGSRYGYTLMDMALRMKKGSRVVSIDLPDQEGWNDPNAVHHLVKNVQMIKGFGFDAHLKLDDSHKPEVVEWAKSLGPYDIVFIDGDHTYEGVKQDWENYGPLGKTVIFHDIRQPRPPEWMGLGVYKLWNTIREEPNTEEFLALGSKMGIGKIVHGTSVSA